MDNHEKWLEAVSAYADGECSDREGATVEAHLNECPDCRTWLEQIRGDQEVFAESLMARPADILDPVMKRVTEMSAPQKQPETRKTPMTMWRLIEVTGIVAACAVLVAVFFPVSFRAHEMARQPTAGPPPSGAPEEPEIHLRYPREDRLHVADRVTTLDEERIADAQAKAGSEVAATAFRGRLGGEDEAVPQARIATEVPATTGIQPTEPGRDWGIRRPIQLGYDAALEVWVKDLQESVVIAERTFYDHGGFVLDSTMVQVETLRQPRRAQIVGKVPKEKVADAINALAALGWVAQRDIMGEDLTDQYTQTTRTLTKLQEQINKLTEERKSASKARRAEIDRQIKALKDDLGPAQDEYHDVQKELVLSTISARLVEKTPRAPLGKSLRAAWESFVYAIARVGVVLAWILLYGLFLVPVIAAVVIYRRWRRQ